MSSFTGESLPVGTDVVLTGLSNAEYNGRRGRIAVTAHATARGRAAVIVDGQTLSFKLANIRRHIPSDASDESDEDEDDEAAPPPPKRAKASSAEGVFALSILTGWSSIETSTIVGVYATWREVVTKAKEILEKGYKGKCCSFWCSEENGGYRAEDSEDNEGGLLEDKTAKAKAPTGDETCELATAEYCEGGKGQMILVAQRLSGVALA